MERARRVKGRWRESKMGTEREEEGVGERTAVRASSNTVGTRHIN